jgi:hypothetical protein
LHTLLLAAVSLGLPAGLGAAADPRTNSWLTSYTGRYARIYTNEAARTAGAATATWSNGTQTQALPAYAGVQAVYSSSNWVYLRTSGLAQHTMGPWQNGSFPNLPKNQNVLYCIPRLPVAHTGTNLTGLGAIGYFVDGVAMFDSRDGFVWTGSGESGNGTGYWNREAYRNEGATFDPGYAHQENTGTHHYHANPIALRHLLDDHVEYNAATDTYTEATNAVTKHSPILGWVRDGYPVYGPYGYASASNAASGLRRMISGFVLRNGQHGTDNLTNTLRASLPAWASRLYAAAQAGPSDLTTYPVGRYLEDYAYLGDLTNPATGLRHALGVDFDLDEYNGRWCVTPEFPGGTYAYFVSMSPTGTPVFPNNIGRAYYGNPTGHATNLTESVTTNFLGGANLRETLSPPQRSGSTVVLTWSAVEGGTYRVESTATYPTWTTNATNIAAVQTAAAYTNSLPDGSRFFRVARTGLASYDGGASGAGATLTVPGGSVSRGGGTNITLSITLPGNPPSPPAGAPLTSVTLGSRTATSTSYTTQGTVLANFFIPANAPTGAQTVVVTFQPPPSQTQGPSYTFTGGFTINP